MLLACTLLVALGAIWLQVTLTQIENGHYGTLDSIEWLNPLYSASTGTKVYSSDGKILASYFTENRVTLPFDSLSEELVQCLVASEDPEHFSSYQKSPFINCFSIAYRGLSGYNSLPGQETPITRQLVNQLHFLLWSAPRETNQFIRLLRYPVFMGILEKAFSKEEIVAIYLNSTDFLYGAYGIQAASQTYFDKRASELNWQEAAALVAMLKGPSLYNVRKNKDTAHWARNEVFQKLADQKVITEVERDSLSKLEVILRSTDHFEKQQPAQQFLVQLRSFLHQWQEEHGYNIYRDGLKVYTTLNYRMQKHAEQAVQKHLRYLQKNFNKHWQGRELPWIASVPVQEQIRYSQRYNWLLKKIQRKHDRRPNEEDITLEFSKARAMTVFSHRGNVDTVLSPMDSAHYYQQLLQASVLAIEPQTGAVKVWVSGLNHPHFRQDHITTPRQLATAFMPFIYAKAFESGFTPCTTLRQAIAQVKPDQLFNNPTWSNIPLVQAFATSQNSTTRALINHIGQQEILNSAKSFGLTIPLEPVDGELLTSFESSLLELTAAYNVFNNGGQHVAPYFISRIEDSSGNILQSFEPEKRFVLDSATNYLMLQMLEKVIQRGTGVRLISSHYYGIRTPLAGKTGTTPQGSDAWFLGFQPDLTIGVWAGSQHPKVAFRDMSFGQGARMALPIFGDFINTVNADEELGYGKMKDFPKPSEGAKPIDCQFLRSGM